MTAKEEKEKRKMRSILTQEEIFAVFQEISEDDTGGTIPDEPLIDQGEPIREASLKSAVRDLMHFDSWIADA